MIRQHHARNVQQGSLRKVDITSKGRRSAVRALQAPTRHLDQLQLTVSRAQWAVPITTTTIGLRAKSVV